MNVAVIGYGLIGKQRVEAIKRMKVEGFGFQDIFVYDPYVKNIDDKDIELLLSENELNEICADFIVIATPHYLAPTYAKTVLDWDTQFVLMEKPFCRSYKEAIELMNQIGKNSSNLYVGHNYRFYEGIQSLVYDTVHGKFGDLISIEAILGHGGKQADKDTWKLDYELAGGGVFLDLGIHLLDILKIINGDQLIPLYGKMWEGFWKTGKEEEVHLTLRGWDDCIVNLQTSLVRWRNTFEIRVNGTEGYGVVSGRGGNYGDQTYVRGKRWGWQSGVSQKESEELVLTTDCKDSFYEEMKMILGEQSSYSYLKPCTASEGLELMKLYNWCMDVLESNK